MYGSPDRSNPALPRSRGMHKGAAALLWGEPAAAMPASAFCWWAACFRRGGNHPRPGLPPGGNGKGGIRFLAAAGYFCYPAHSNYSQSTPSIRLAVQLSLALRRSPIDPLQIGGHPLAVLPAHVIQALSHKMHDTQLNPRLRKHALDRLREALQSVNARDQHVLHPAVLQFGQYTQPELGGLI